MKTDEVLMRRCLELGKIAFQKGDAPVGALIALNGQVIAEAFESVKAKNDPTAHAEIEAVRASCPRRESLNLSGAIIYTNVEPCIMCAFAIRQTGIKRVIFGISNNKVGGASSNFANFKRCQF